MTVELEVEDFGQHTNRLLIAKHLFTKSNNNKKRIFITAMMEEEEFAGARSHILRQIGSGRMIKIGGRLI